ncbi:MAG TPA: hypothetical protein VG965_03130 [Patescibacteria group bacterium]|nr:hypothetical protein [Patescibacteria group bacterium]
MQLLADATQSGQVNLDVEVPATSLNSTPTGTNSTGSSGSSGSTGGKTGGGSSAGLSGTPTQVGIASGGRKASDSSILANNPENVLKTLTAPLQDFNQVILAALFLVLALLIMIFIFKNKIVEVINNIKAKTAKQDVQKNPEQPKSLDEILNKG